MRARVLTPGVRRLSLALCAALALVSAFGTADAFAATTGANPIISARIPQPGLISATLFDLTVRLTPGARPPHRLVFKPVRRTRLPRDVAVIASARLVRQSAPGTATYAGLVTVFRSRKLHTAGEANRKPTLTPEDIAKIWLEQTVAFARHAIIRFGEALIGERLDEFWDEDPLDEPLSELIRLLQTRRGPDPGAAFRWSWDMPPSLSVTAAKTEKDIVASFHGNLLAYKLHNLDQELHKDFPFFTRGSLKGDTARPSPIRSCVVSYDFTVAPPPYNGLDFQGPPPLAVPAAATDIVGVFSDKATADYPGPNPWTGVTWKKSYEGRARSADPVIAKGYWELVLQFNGSGDPSQPTGPDRTWVYAVSYHLKAEACPPGAKQLG